MALVDFYQLATLHKLSRVDAGFPSICSHRPRMADTPPPPSPSPSVEPDDIRPPTRPPTPPSTQLQPKTPERKPNAARLVPGPPPLARGASVRQKQDGDTSRVDG